MSKQRQRSSLSNGKLGISLPFFIVDSFADGPFQGNPAAVCLVQGVQDIPDATKQGIAQEMNLSETCFVSTMSIDQKFSECREFNLRWFTPTNEVSLCGHGTIAVASIIFNECENINDKLSFQTLHGEISVRRSGNLMVLDFPQHKPSAMDVDEEVSKIIDEVLRNEFTAVDVQYCQMTKTLLIRLEDFISRGMLEDLKVPSMERLLAAHDGSKVRCVIVTVSGNDGYDFISRVFCPWNGIAEDPVTGSAHSVLGPYWSERLKGKQELVACQCSPRGGDLHLSMRGAGRMDISGSAVTVMKGELDI
ncbi:unnamed protein product [Cyprideis torosa]|uniref:Uncharacterized protein n=1 Tax=Cyprideis torosa TaxID=163714 RepID=A0A7R8WHK8_9CRUS|nr:unnamed protein product [Cyprideis torosa]CAG0899556.1 unnamed protein product [Cyprideis torosa]